MLQMHWPEVQVPAPQLLLHEPQAFGSLERSTQPTFPMHFVCPMLQTHWPDVHTPWPQLVLQLPQCAGSADTSKQPVLHVMSPALHVQTLFTQAAPGLQVMFPHMTPPLELLVELELEPLEEVDVELEVEPLEEVEVEVEVELEVEPLEVEVEVEPLEVDVEVDVVPGGVAVSALPLQPSSVSQAEALRRANTNGNRKALCMRESS